jgi:micrococcal nuclease
MVRASRRAGFACWLLALVASVAAAGCGFGAGATARYRATVTRDVDGDTVVVRYTNGRTDKVRLLGVDTPETHKPNTPVQCYGPEASRYTEHALVGRVVDLELDEVTRDKYGRLLAYVYVGGRRFDDELLRLGYGRLLIIPPNGVHARAMLAAELDAKRARRGLWGAC